MIFTKKYHRTRKTTWLDFVLVAIFVSFFTIVDIACISGMKCSDVVKYSADAVEIFIGILVLLYFFVIIKDSCRNKKNKECPNKKVEECSNKKVEECSNKKVEECSNKKVEEYQNNVFEIFIKKVGPAATVLGLISFLLVLVIS